MPSKKSRRVREHKTLVNKPHRTIARTRVVTARAAIVEDASSDEAKTSVDEAVKALAKAVGKGVLHKNNASRRISRLVKAQSKALAE
ncbi:MAG: 30S ribosomal protein S20 [Chloroflexi bacterium]|nr:30S ribosomal protein S20 [Chloroflexota bacterium]